MTTSRRPIVNGWPSKKLSPRSFLRRWPTAAGMWMSDLAVVRRACETDVLPSLHWVTSMTRSPPPPPAVPFASVSRHDVISGRLLASGSSNCRFQATKPHNYGVRWSENGAKFFVDGQVVMTGPQRSYEQQLMIGLSNFPPGNSVNSKAVQRRLVHSVIGASV